MELSHEAEAGWKTSAGMNLDNYALLPQTSDLAMRDGASKHTWNSTVRFLGYSFTHFDNTVLL